jgi:NAD-dependent SIR2 family protein deacetylase
MIETMIQNMMTPFEVRGMDIPLCPRCGRFLIPNLRCGANFVEAPHMVNAKGYQAFLDSARHGKLTLLELGVGFNTPGIIRFPFEQIVKKFAGATLVRINRDDITTAWDVSHQYIGIQADLSQVLGDILREIAS